MNNMEDQHPKIEIGKDIIESLTLGMYEDCRFIYREYIQNAADAIDKAIQKTWLEKGKEEIHVHIDNDKRQISISDNGTGIEKNRAVEVLCNIAKSTKRRGEDKGFRGIGRLGGLGYCNKLIFETSYKGEPFKTILVWDAELLKLIINNRDTEELAAEVIERVTQTTFTKEKEDSHYFNVIMDEVTSDDLLDIRSVTDYLSMVAPVDIRSNFIFRQKIDDFKKKNGLSVDTYNIYVNDEQIYKPYTSVIYEDNNGGKKKVDDISDVDFLLSKDNEGNIMYWGWYTISSLKGQMKPKNIARGIRLRKENIQIGDEEICKKFFSKTEDQRFSFYYFGEIHALSKGLIPNSRRDYFGESPECSDFERRIKQDFLKLKELCYDAQKVRSSATTLAKGSELRTKIEEKEKYGYTSQKERDDLQRQLEEHQKKEEQAKKQLSNVTKKIESANSPLKGVIERLKPTDTHIKKNVSIVSKTASSSNVMVGKTVYRTDAPIYSAYNKKEKKLIGKIYAAISNAIADETMREALIGSIEKEITK